MHIDAYSLFKGADDLVIRTVINHDFGFNKKESFILFFHEMQQPALSCQIGWDSTVVVDPNCWFATKIWILPNNICAFFYHNRWGDKCPSGQEVSFKASLSTWDIAIFAALEISYPGTCNSI